MSSRSSLALAALAATVLLGGCSLGPTELLLILAIVVVLFGASRLPQLGKALGETVKSFKESTGGDDDKSKELEAEKEKKKLGEKKDSVSEIEEAKVERVDKKD